MEDTDVTKKVEDEAITLEVLEKNLNDLEGNSKKLMESVEKLNLQSDIHLDELASEITKLQDNVENALGPFWQRIKNEMFDVKCYVKDKEEELRRLRSELENQENVSTNLKNELKYVKTTLFHQSSYTASLGAVLCTLLWRACGEEVVVVELLKQKKLVDFLEMVPSSLRSFFISFGENLPSIQSREYQFILSIIGMMTNIAAVPEGRKFLVGCREGDQIIRELLETVSKIPKSGTYIHRTILLVLYNVSLDKRGMLIIKNDTYILPLLVKNISQPDGKLRHISLKLFQSLAYDVEDVNFLEALFKAIHSVKLEELQQHCKNDEKVMIAHIMDNMASAKQHLQNLNGFRL